MACIFFMKVTLLQPDIKWEDRQGNLDSFEKIIGLLQGSSDLVILPEMFGTGFSMNVRVLAEYEDSVTLKWMHRIAFENRLAVCGSYIAGDDKKYFNRFVFVTPEGETWSYDKRHLFRMGEEDKYFSEGKRRIVFEYMEFRIIPVVCYDLRFPVWMRNRNDYDMIICVANWPGSRRAVWNILLRARAIENQCFVIGANRVGQDNAGIEYFGESVIIDPKGSEIVGLPEPETGYITGEITKSDLEEFRQKFPVWRDSDDFRLIV